MKLIKSNFFIVGGSSRNVGKTSFICQVIHQFSAENRISAIKISNHFHDLNPDLVRVIIANDDYIIAEEKGMTSSKDTSRYLKAGADNAFIIMAKNETLSLALNKFFSQIDVNSDLFIVESAAILQFVQPGVSVFVTDDLSHKSNSGFDFLVYTNPKFDFQESVDNILVKGKEWLLK